MSVLAEFGIDSVGEVIDPRRSWRSTTRPAPTSPARSSLGALETRFGIARKDLVEWARHAPSPRSP